MLYLPQQDCSGIVAYPSHVPFLCSAGTATQAVRASLQLQDLRAAGEKQHLGILQGGWPACQEQLGMDACLLLTSDTCAWKHMLRQQWCACSQHLWFVIGS
jgi:hypothetical protein